MNYQENGTWYPATFKGKDKQNRNGLYGVECDDYAEILGTALNTIRLPAPLYVGERLKVYLDDMKIWCPVRVK